MIAVRKYLTLFLVGFVGSLGVEAQFTSQGTAANYAGGTLTGGSFETQVSTGQFGGTPVSDDFGIYIGLSAFTLESGIVSVESTADGILLTDATEGTLLRLESSGNYDSIDVAISSDGALVFSPVFAGDYLVNVDSDPEKYVATYFGNSFLWEDAEILRIHVAAK